MADINDLLDSHLARQNRNHQEFHTITFENSMFSSQIFRFVMDSVTDITLGGELYQASPISLSRLSEDSQLSSGFAFSVGSANSQFLAQIKRVGLASDEIIKVNVAVWLSTDLTLPMESYDVEAAAVSLTRTADGEVFTGEAGAPIINNNQCGEMYNLHEMPMLRGFL